MQAQSSAENSKVCPLSISTIKNLVQKPLFNNFIFTTFTFLSINSVCGLHLLIIIKISKEQHILKQCLKSLLTHWQKTSLKSHHFVFPAFPLHLFTDMLMEYFSMSQQAKNMVSHSSPQKKKKKSFSSDNKSPPNLGISLVSILNLKPNRKIWFQSFCLCCNMCNSKSLSPSWSLESEFITIIISYVRFPEVYLAWPSSPCIIESQFQVLQKGDRNNWFQVVILLTLRTQKQGTYRFRKISFINRIYFT